MHRKWLHHRSSSSCSFRIIQSRITSIFTYSLQWHFNRFSSLLLHKLKLSPRRKNSFIYDTRVQSRTKHKEFHWICLDPVDKKYGWKKSSPSYGRVERSLSAHVQMPARSQGLFLARLSRSLLPKRKLTHVTMLSKKCKTEKRSCLNVEFESKA